MSLLDALRHLVPWQIRRPALRDVALLHDAEFQIMLRELRYPPIRHVYDTSSGSAGSRHPEKYLKR
jgi:hypothetical protein